MIGADAAVATADRLSTTPKNEHRYYPLLDGIRALAAFAVVTNHTDALFGFSFQKGYLAVDLFYALSGLVVASAYDTKLLSGMSALQFARIRIIRLFPLYIFALMLAIVSNSIYPSGEFDQSKLPEVIFFGFFMLPVLDANIHNAFPLVGPSWSLFFELFANFVYAAFVKRLSNLHIIGIMALSAITLLILSAFVPTHNLNMGWTRRTFIAGFPRVGYSFGAGVLLYRLFPKLPAIAVCRRNPAITSIAIMMCVATLVGADLSGWVSLIWDCTAAFLLFPIIIYVAMQVQLERTSRSILAYLGMASYMIYVVHKPLFDIIQGNFARLHSPNVLADLHPWSGIAFGLCLLAAAYPLDRYYDRPIRRLFGGRPVRRDL